MPAKRVPPRTMPDRWEDSADVVVVGYGYAGAVAAMEAHDAGVPASNSSPSAAIEFLKFITSPEAARSWAAAGLELAGP